MSQNVNKKLKKNGRIQQYSPEFHSFLSPSLLGFSFFVLFLPRVPVGVVRNFVKDLDVLAYCSKRSITEHGLVDDSIKSISSSSKE